MTMMSRAGRVWQNAPGAVAAVSGWRRFAMAFGFGVLAATALPPLHAIPVLLVSFTGLIWQLDAAVSRRTGFALGWWFGVGFFAAGLYWIAHALLTDPARFGWLIPFAIGGLSAGLAVFSGLATLLTGMSRASRSGRVFIFAAAWTAMEWLRGAVLTGFPWNPLGNVWTVSIPMMQVAAFTGVFGLSLLTVFAAGAPAGLADSGRRRWIPIGAAAVALAVLWAGGSARLAGAEINVVPDVLIRIVQPNIAQRQKWRDGQRVAQVAKQVRLSARAQPIGSRITHIVWPETAVPYFLAQAPDLRQAIARIVPPGGLLITGTLRTTLPKRPYKLWNALQAVDQAGQIVASYDKFHLVPFGEYFPLRSILGFAKITAGSTDFSSGPGPRTLRLAGLPPVSPLICYEAIFPGEVTDRLDRPGWLLNVTNDAWFGVSSGPYQHFASAQLRAVEEGLPLVRAANGGVSGVVDPYGRITARLGLDVEGVIDGTLPVALTDRTRFAKWGHGPVAVLVVLMVVCGLALRENRSG